jgi:hypothetical protein
MPCKNKPRTYKCLDHYPKHIAAMLAKQAKKPQKNNMPAFATEGSGPNTMIPSTGTSKKKGLTVSY